MEINCFQFEMLMNFYLDNELSNKIKKAFEAHLENCKQCREKFTMFKKIINDLRNTYSEISSSSKNNSTSNRISQTKQDEINDYISAYVDNELDINENIKIKKMIINKSDIKEKVERMYSLKTLLQDNFQKSTPKQDYSKNLMKQFSKKDKPQNNDYLLATLSFIVLCLVWIVMLIASL